MKKYTAPYFKPYVMKPSNIVCTSDPIFINQDETTDKMDSRQRSGIWEDYE